ncbi:MAG: hypothetical protein Q9160_004895 [Pyrenula sp. 1 TL-2023]
MSRSSRKIILLGAPTSSSLDWSESCLIPWKDATHVISSLRPFKSPEQEGPQWRQLSLAGVQWGAEFSSRNLHDSTFLTGGSFGDVRQHSDAPPTTPGIWTEVFPRREASFDDISVSNPSEDTDTLLSEFYDKSFVSDESFGLLQASPTAASPDRLSPGPSTARAEHKSFAREYSDYSHVPRFSADVHVTNLKELPSASYLNNIQPQTMTINIVVGIIALPAPVTVPRRSNGSKIDLVEMLVGDDTRSAFGISIWLPYLEEAVQPPQGKDTLRSQIASLRPTDIVLIRNLALGSFRGKVHGQSLHRGITKIDLLRRRNITRGERLRDLNGSIGSHGIMRDFPELGDGLLMKKASQVHQWLLQFVGAPAYISRPDVPGRHSLRKGFETLPPDTQ